MVVELESGQKVLAMENCKCIIYLALMDLVVRMIDSKIEKIRNEANTVVDHAAEKFGEVLDQRIEKIRSELDELLTSKIKEVRDELALVADDQKKSAIRNASVAIFSSLVVAVISVGYKKVTSGDLDPYFLFRSLLLAVVAGQFVWMISRLISNYINMSKIQKNAVLYVASFTGAFRITGLVSHLIVALVLVCMWLAVYFRWG